MGGRGRDQLGPVNVLRGSVGGQVMRAPPLTEQGANVQGVMAVMWASLYELRTGAATAKHTARKHRPSAESEDTCSPEREGGALSRENFLHTRARIVRNRRRLQNMHMYLFVQHRAFSRVLRGA